MRLREKDILAHMIFILLRQLKPIATKPELLAAFNNLCSACKKELKELKNASK